MADAVVIGSMLIDTVDRAVRALPTGQKREAAVVAAGQCLSAIRAALNHGSKNTPSA